MSKKGQLKRFFLRAFYAIRTHRIDTYSAQSAFFLFLSIFPFLMLLLSLLNRIPAFVSWQQTLDLSILPDTVEELLESILNEINTKSSGAVLGVSAVVTLWSASKGFYSVTKGLRCIYRMDESPNYLAIRLISLIHTLIFLFSLLLLLVFFVFGQSLFDLLVQFIPRFAGFELLISLIRNGLSFFTLSLVFIFFYWVIPGRQHPLRMQIPGALLSALGWVLFTWLYALYTDHFGNYSYLYGSLTAVVLLMLWLYFCVFIFFLGAELNSLLQADLLILYAQRKEEKRLKKRRKAAKEKND